MNATSKEFTPVCAFRDLAHETKTRQEMEVSRTYLQVVLSEYLRLEIGTPSDIYQLLNRSETVFNKTLQALIEAPATTDGRFKTNKAAYMQTLDLPDPTTLYAACTTAKKQAWCAVTGIWAIEGNKVVLVESEALQYIDRQSIYAASPEKAMLAEDVQKLCDLWNSLNARLNGELVNPMDSYLNRWAIGKFKVKEYTTGKANIEPDRDAMKRWLSL